MMTSLTNNSMHTAQHALKMEECNAEAMSGLI